jgi:predicted DNA-binding WGR domain protein
MMVIHEDADQAAAALMKLDKQKRHRGYVAVTTFILAATKIQRQQGE